MFTRAIRGTRSSCREHFGFLPVISATMIPLVWALWASWGWAQAPQTPDRFDEGWKQHQRMMREMDRQLKLMETVNPLGIPSKGELGSSWLQSTSTQQSFSFNGNVLQRMYRDGDLTMGVCGTTKGTDWNIDRITIRHEGKAVEFVSVKDVPAKFRQIVKRVIALGVPKNAADLLPSTG